MPAAYALMAAAHGPETRSRAVRDLRHQPVVGVAAGGSLSGFVAERLHWRASFWILGGVGIPVRVPLWRFFSSMPEHFARTSAGKPAQFATFLGLLRIPSLRVVTTFVAVATFGLFLVYTWLPTFLFDKFHLGLARAGFEASVYPQVGTAFGLITGAAIADRYYKRIRPARFWVVTVGAVLRSALSRFDRREPDPGNHTPGSHRFGFFAGFIAANQAAAAFDVVPASLRASTVGVLNFLGATVSGFAPFLGGLARRTIGVEQLMAFTSAVYIATGLFVIYGTLATSRAITRARRIPSCKLSHSHLIHCVPIETHSEPGTLGGVRNPPAMGISEATISRQYRSGPKVSQA